MQASAFFTRHRGPNNEIGDQGQVSKLNQVIADFVVGVVFMDFSLEQVYTVLGSLQALVCSHDTHIIPHEAAQLVPVMGDHNVFIRVCDPAFVPTVRGGHLWGIWQIR